MGMDDFIREPLTDFTKSENKKAFEEALHRVNSQLGMEYPLIINEERILTEEKIYSYNPAIMTELIGTVSKANKEHAKRAMQAATAAFDLWKKWNPEDRVRLLWRAASILRGRKHEFSACLVKEVGKTWVEADTEIAEAIDSIEYYAKQMMSLNEGAQEKEVEGEGSQYQYIPLGVGIIISSFHFQLANMAKTAIVAIAAGNTVLLKPSNQAPVIAAKFVQLMEEAGLPKGVLNYIPGSRAEIVDFFVDHPKTRFISFTGPPSAGCRIYERAAVVHPGQVWLKRVMVDMHGKNTVVVDEEADLDLAASTIVYSGFGFSGQKHSAGTRVVVHEKVYEIVLEKAIALIEKVKVGNPEKAETTMGPVIDREAYYKIMTYIKIGKKEGELVTGGKGHLSQGYYIEPTIFSDVDIQSHMMQDEICGPIIAFCKACNIDQLIEMANHSEYGSTGFFFSKSRQHIERVRDELNVRYLYINRKSTEANVGCQPFGDFHMYGRASKADGPDYLLRYMKAKVISESL